MTSRTFLTGDSSGIDTTTVGLDPGQIFSIPRNRRFSASGSDEGFVARRRLSHFCEKAE